MDSRFSVKNPLQYVAILAATIRRLRVDQVPKIQADLKFHDAVREEVNERKVNKVYVSPWLHTEDTNRVLHQKVYGRAQLYNFLWYFSCPAPILRTFSKSQIGFPQEEFWVETKGVGRENYQFGNFGVSMRISLFFC